MKIKCPNPKCHGVVTSVQRREADVEWEYIANEDRWKFGVYDSGSHFHVICHRGCDLKYRGLELPLELQKIIYPEMFKN